MPEMLVRLHVGMIKQRKKAAVKNETIHRIVVR